MWETGTDNIVPAAGPVPYMFLREQTALGSYLSSIKLVFLNGAASKDVWPFQTRSKFVWWREEGSVSGSWWHLMCCWACSLWFFMSSAICEGCKGLRGVCFLFWLISILGSVYSYIWLSRIQCKVRCYLHSSEVCMSWCFGNSNNRVNI